MSTSFGSFCGIEILLLLFRLVLTTFYFSVALMAFGTFFDNNVFLAFRLYLSGTRASFCSLYVLLLTFYSTFCGTPTLLYSFFFGICPRLPSPLSGTHKLLFSLLLTFNSTFCGTPHPLLLFLLWYFSSRPVSLSRYS